MRRAVRCGSDEGVISSSESTNETVGGTDKVTIKLSQIGSSNKECFFAMKSTGTKEIIWKKVS